MTCEEVEIEPKANIKWPTTAAPTTNDAQSSEIRCATRRCARAVSARQLKGNGWAQNRRNESALFDLADVSDSSNADPTGPSRSLRVLPLVLVLVLVALGAAVFWANNRSGKESSRSNTVQSEAA